MACGALLLSGCGSAQVSGPASTTPIPSALITSATPDPSPSSTSSSTSPGALGATASATASPSPASALAGAVIGIDPGHNGRNHTRPDVINRLIRNGRGDDTTHCNTTGTATDGGYPEATFTFAVATELAALLRARGAEVVMTRTSNDGVGPCVDARAETINQAHADVAIDLHADGGPASGRGFAILLPVGSGTNDAVVAPSRRYATLLREELLETGMPTSSYDGKDGLKERTDLAGLNLTTVPQLLLEAGNMRNPTDAALLTSKRFQHQLARAILRAMERFLAR
ncbi:MAG: N-acetylmuramoyl-L-alanine amidase [Nocardioides sp.]|uniref:N-acetylmuramoyl-L-alanine amidase n=1 Tax=Nocardioides sp. TaxID=35761 RepID=UPI0039E4B823